MTRQGLLVGALALLCVLITIGQPRFLTLYNWLNIFQQAAAIGLVSSGVALLMIGGGFDLSVGSVVALGGYLVAVGFGAGLPIPLVILLAVLAGAAVGAVNGFGVAYLRIPALIMTLGSLYVVRGGVLFLSGGETAGRGYPEAFTFLGKGDLAGLPVPAIIMGVAYVALYLVHKKTRFGRYTIAVGTDADIARRAGINARFHIAKLYILSGALAAAAGVMLAARLNASTTNAGLGYELEVIASVVIGGTSLFGGEGTIAGTLLGVIFLAVVHNALNLLGVSPFLQQFAIGSLLLFSAAADIIAPLVAQRRFSLAAIGQLRRSQSS
ncbi:MAG: ABC transporter permease [Caldilineaceae bacterium]|nr:ABC transporter permease [Caldilineaceae bacterium]MCY4093247.1 ABC transporter permease [Caldilineaceae bacterium]MDE0070123.1 ABC transporter permease [Caldilineaceae bacterium]